MEEYKAVSVTGKRILKFSGLVETLLVGMWTFALAKAIRRQSDNIGYCKIYRTMENTPENYS